ncbi:uncharacterized protein LOC131538146 [Onychostoma macrolepis]|uniref:Uncharacterized protein n=1 Tax=Onychostoma macrolepis TaxID=369639 RepID=A0A7J6D7R1_9TELE|nr:uncharacterized protein LOC131538146 [Onychostoma macrolepis]KAF4115034.1 hypothetical protein G5714_002523 [Onychostoma macrolepis]
MAANFSPQKNARKAKPFVCKEQHIAINDLKIKDEIKHRHMYKTYLLKDIPEYPSPVEFHITEVAHVTNKTSLEKIWNSGGFKGLDTDSFSWWSLKINEADIRAAEERYLEKLFPDMTKEEKTVHPPFLREFTTSPLFLNELSRYGNFRFTFPVNELMETYKKQKCEGQEPILRIYGTKLFSQEIEYVVLVHSPEFNWKFGHFPLLKSSPWVAYDGHQIIWKAQAICETHNFQLVIRGGTAVTEYMPSHQFYVWDHVSLVFHSKDVLTVPQRKLKGSLSCCELDRDVDLSNGKNCSFDEAEKFIKSLPDDESEKEDEKEEYKSVEVKMEMD